MCFSQLPDLIKKEGPLCFKEESPIVVAGYKCSVMNKEREMVLLSNLNFS